MKSCNGNSKNQPSGVVDKDREYLDDDHLENKNLNNILSHSYEDNIESRPAINRANRIEIEYLYNEFSSNHVHIFDDQVIEHYENPTNFITTTNDNKLKTSTTSVNYDCIYLAEYCIVSSTVKAFAFLWIVGIVLFLIVIYIIVKVSTVYTFFLKSRSFPRIRRKNAKNLKIYILTLFLFYLSKNRKEKTGLSDIDSLTNS